MALSNLRAFVILAVSAFPFDVGLSGHTPLAVQTAASLALSVGARDELLGRAAGDDRDRHDRGSNRFGGNE
jgi:hypothetical protein